MSRQNAMVWNDLEQITKRIEATPKQATHTQLKADQSCLYRS